MKRKLFSFALLGVLVALVAVKGSLFVSGATWLVGYLPLPAQLIIAAIALLVGIVLSGHISFDLFVITLILWFMPSIEWQPLEEAVYAGVRMFSVTGTSRATLYLRYILVMNVVSWLVYVVSLLGIVAFWRGVKRPARSAH